MHGLAGAGRRWVRWVASVDPQMLSHLHLGRIWESIGVAVNMHMKGLSWRVDAG